MKKLFFVLIISVLLLISAQPKAQENSADAQRLCENVNADTKLAFTTSYGKLIYDFSLSKNELSEIAQQVGIFEKGVFAAGLALVSINSEYELSTVTKVMHNNSRCIIPTHLNVYIGLTKPTIFMARELQPGTCTYNLVLRHEQVHQQINKQALEYFIPLIRRELSARIKQIRPVYVSKNSSEDDASQELTARYNELITPLVNRLRDQIMSEQHKLDSSRNYKMEGNICRSFNRKSR